MTTPTVPAMPALPPLSLYIHVPWCVRKCPYCDFNSHTFHGDLPEQDYLNALGDDLEADTALSAERTVETIFIGGGTPSLMSSRFYQQLFGRLAQHLSIAGDAEITLEANPGTVEQGRFDGFRQAGINRLSIGVQSFNPRHLKTLGRIHDDRAAHRAIAAAKAAGFENFNLDLMHGLPDQSVDDALADLDAALQWQPPHLSWYQLTVEPNTEFYSKPPMLPDDERLWAIFEAGKKRLQQAGLADYEVSAWSLPGKASKHNLNYWQFGDYLALGAGGHGKITHANGDIERYWKTRQPDAYLKRIGSRTSGRQLITPEDRTLEFMMNALRLTDGVEESLYNQRTGLPFASITGILKELRGKQLLQPDRLQTTALGQRYLNSLLERFL